jgi:hypothetical protein
VEIIRFIDTSIMPYNRPNITFDAQTAPAALPSRFRIACKVWFEIECQTIEIRANIALCVFVLFNFWVAGVKSDGTVNIQKLEKKEANAHQFNQFF